MDREKKALIDKLDAEIEQARLEIDRLQAKARETEADTRIEIEDQIQKLKDKRNDAAAKLDELKDSGGHAFEDLRAGIEHAWQTLSTAAKNASERFR